jgi:hypothetical protein
LEDCHKINGAINGTGDSAKASFQAALSAINGDDLASGSVYWTITPYNASENYTYSLGSSFNQSGVFHYTFNSILSTIAVMSF